MSKKVHTSKADFKLFKQTCSYYLELFGITDYEVEFLHENLSEDTLAATGWWTDRETKNITFRLATDWSGTEITNAEIEATAFHEVLHGLLCRINNIANDRYISKVDIGEECHVLINRIMRAFANK